MQPFGTINDSIMFAGTDQTHVNVRLMLMGTGNEAWEAYVTGTAGDTINARIDQFWTDS